MFMDVCLSNVGKATNQQIIGLQKTLGMNSDPCLPATHASEWKPAKTPSDPVLLTSSQADLSQLYADLSRPKNGEQAHEVTKSSSAVWPRSAAIMQEREIREKTRSSSTFKNRGRQELEALEAKVTIAPPVGTYNPKDDCAAAYSRVKHPPCQSHSFGLRERTRSLKAKRTEAQILRLRSEGQSIEHLLGDRGRELPEVGIVENTLAQRRHIVLCDISKQSARPDIIKSANIVINDPIALSTRGFMHGHESCARYGKHYRQPCFDFAKQSTAKPKPVDSYTQPGEYNVNIAYIKPKLGAGNLPFESRPSRKDIHEGCDRPGDHLPDRSLARGSPILTAYSRMRSPPVAVPNFNKDTSRASIA